MLVKTLVEDTAVSDEYKAQYGFSLYIQTQQHRLLFDLGGNGLFAENALKMGVDIAEIDLVVISHGHRDHGGGLETFLNLNDHARIYVHQDGFNEYCFWKSENAQIDIGLNRSLQDHERIIFTGDHLVIDEELELFANVPMHSLNAPGNRSLMKKTNRQPEPDDFRHEQHLLIHEDDDTVLVSGCSHTGIIGIMEHVKKLGHQPPKAVIGGFHLIFRTADAARAPEFVEQLGRLLAQYPAVFYTGHCTGTDYYHQLKQQLGNQIHYLATGSQVEIA